MTVTPDVGYIDDENENNPDAPKRKFSIGRSGVKLIATSSVRFVISSAITTLVPVETKREKRKIFVASMVLSGMLNEQVKPYVDREIDEAIDFCREVYKYAQKMQEQQEQKDSETDAFVDVVHNAPDL